LEDKSLQPGLETELSSPALERSSILITRSVVPILLAAGESKRMGQPKMGLPWGNTTVIGQVVTTLAQAGLEQIVVVIGGGRTEVLEALGKLPGNLRLQTVYNPDYASEEMSRSLQYGLEILERDVEAAMVVLGDQPQIETVVVKAVLSAFLTSHARLVVPSYQMRRGHPWIVERSLWPELMALHPPYTLRNFLQNQAAIIEYVKVDSPSILKDLDTPQQYRESKPAVDG